MLRANACIRLPLAARAIVPVEGRCPRVLDRGLASNREEDGLLDVSYSTGGERDLVPLARDSSDGNEEVHGNCHGESWTNEDAGRGGES